ncbi:phage tail protein [Leuconostoc sp. UCMA20149]|uniref:phage tail protein n=1 Tax=Leuconostoc sp. UCMA20149 TaxID=2583528 RepID=UPI0025AF3B43|nr:phage tail protein [Leuconostoc sp. UCMA20149]MDN2450997.1 phage tail protein [Leuconostoc sp. UCMA20149]
MSVGLRLVQYAIVDDSRKLIADAVKGLSADGVYAADKGVISAKTANITGIEAAPTKVYGNNKAVDLQHSKGDVSVALDFNKLPQDILNKLLGRVSDGKGGYTKGDKPNVAMLITSDDIDSNDQIYYGFGFGQLVRPSLNNGTNTNAETRADDALTYSALDVDEWGDSIKTWYSGDANFDKAAMLKDVFGGYVAPSSN